MLRPVGENPWNEVGAHPPRSATAFLRLTSQPDFRHGSFRMHPIHSFIKFISVVEQGSRSDKFMHVRISRFSQNWRFGCHRCHSVLKPRRTAISSQRFILHSISALCVFIVVVLSLHSLQIQPQSPCSSLLRTSVSRGRDVHTDEWRLNLPSRIPDVPRSAKRRLKQGTTTDSGICGPKLAMFNVDYNPSGLVLANDRIFSDRDGATRFSKSLYFTGLRNTIAIIL